MDEDPLTELDFTVEIGYDVWYRPEADKWAFGCIPCRKYIEFELEETARWMMKIHQRGSHPQS